MNEPLTAQDYANELQNELNNRLCDPWGSLGAFPVVVKWFMRAQAQSFNQGLDRAAKLIAPTNPEARSANADIRNQCAREIRAAMHLP